MTENENIPRIGLIGISHKTAPVEIRETFSLDDKAMAEFFSLAGKAGIQEIVCVSTCNRVEIYFASDNISHSVEKLVSTFEKISSIPWEKFENLIYKKYYTEAVVHLLTVASSLDSMVLGENEILGQVKDAYRKAASKKKTGPILNKLFHQAFSTAKRVKTETEIAKSPLSVAYIATELAKSIFEDISRRKALMIGAGEMGELILKYLTKYNISEITIANRSFHNAQRIVDEINTDAGIIMLEDIESRLPDIDIVISSISRKDYVITKETAWNMLKEKKNSPLFVIDIAVPRNIDPAIGSIDGIFLYNIDDLQQIADENLKSRIREVELANHLIESDALEFNQWYEELAIVPAIVHIKDKFNKIRESELNRYRKTRLKHLKDNDFEIIDNLTDQIMKKTLHDPIMYLKNFQNTCGEKNEDINESIKLIKELFGK